jgi:hypothetical protein
MTITSTAKSKVYIGAAFNATPQLADYEAQTWQLIGGTVDLGTVGRKQKEITVTTIDNPYVQKLGGSIDNGTMDVVVSYDALDAGQSAVRAGVATFSRYLFKVELPDAPNSTGTPTIYCFQAAILSDELKLGKADDDIEQTYGLSVSGEILIQPADVVITFAPTAGALTGGTASTVYAGETIAATGGIGVVSYAVTTGSLPTGLSLNSATGAISGTPSAAGTSDFTITATFDGAGEANAAYSIVVAA